MKTLHIVTATGGMALLLVVGCAAKPPQELRDARAAYVQASQAPGGNLATSDVYEAKKALGRAEQKFEDDGDEAETRDLAYVAQRKALSAKAKAGTLVAVEEGKQAQLDAQRFQQQQADSTRQQLGQSKDALSQQQRQLDSERQARIAAEQRTQDALERIQGMTAKQDARGLVLTLSGSVLFATGKSTLLPTAQKSLADVVVALKEDPRTITIVGHTDDVGAEEKNLELSRRRAEAVRAFLLTRGVPQDRVNAEGMGESQPIADNTSPEGRANNRRVEIILQGPQQGPQAPAQQGPQAPIMPGERR